MPTIDTRAYARVVRGMVVEVLADGSGDLFHITAHVGYDVGASEGQVRYALRGLKAEGCVGYNRSDRVYYLIRRPEAPMPNPVPDLDAALGGADPMSETTHTLYLLMDEKGACLPTMYPTRDAAQRAADTSSNKWVPVPAEVPAAPSPEAGEREGSRKKQNDLLQRGDMARNLSTPSGLGGAT